MIFIWSLVFSSYGKEAGGHLPHHTIPAPTRPKPEYHQIIELAYLLLLVNSLPSVTTHYLRIYSILYSIKARRLN